MSIEALEGVTDQELFDQANADEAPADEAVVEVPEVKAAEEAVEKVEPEAKVEAEAEVEKPAVEDHAGRVPAFRLREEAEARRRLENDLATERADKAALRQRLEALERPAPKAEAEKPSKPDPLLDPEGFATSVREEIRQELLSERRETSLATAHKVYKEEFVEAYAAAQKQIDPALKAMMQQSRDPGETLIQWHREQKTRAEVGTDPNAYFDKRLEAYLSDQANQAKVLERIRGGVQPQPGSRQPSPVDLPPSLTKIASASADASADDNDISNDGLWRHANA